jgi:putative ABC transport system permease protein
MPSRAALAAASLARHRARTALAVAGIAVSSAMLLDMVMLASGMRESFRTLLDETGFPVRLAPRGTLPMDTEATVGGAAALLASVANVPGVRGTAPVLGGQLHVARPDGTAQSLVALGVTPTLQGDYQVVAGREPVAGDEAVASAAALRALGRRIGDTVTVAAAYDPQLRAFASRRRLTLVARATFTYLADDQPALALPIGTLQALRGEDGRDRVSLVMVALEPGADPDRVARAIEAAVPRVSALTTAEAVRQADERLAYFRNLAAILGSVSLAVGFLLVTTLMTVSVNERIGEIAVQRAIGVRGHRVVWQIILEGLALTVVGATLGLGLGLVTAEWLDGILTTFPGLPPGIRFFVFRGQDAGVALGLLVVSGVAAGAYPSWRAARLPIAATLREEAVA